MIKRIIFLLPFLCFTISSWATDFTIDGVAYTITDNIKQEVAIGTGNGNAAINQTNQTVTILSSIIYNGVKYSVTSIGDNAFNGCINISSITIPNSVISIGTNAFSNCTSLSTFSFESGNSITSIADGTFSGCTNLTSIILPSSITSIGANAFSNSGLTSITIPNLVNAIKISAFQDCVNLSLVTFNLPSSITSFDYYIFKNCSSLATITIPPSIKNLTNKFEFTGCNSLVNIYVSTDNIFFSSLNGVVFDKSLTTLVLYPPGRVGDYKIPSNVTNISGNVFTFNTNITNVIIPSSVSTIVGYGQFNGCENLSEITFMPSNHKISLGAADYMFYNCWKLNKINLYFNNEDSVNYNSNDEEFFRSIIGTTYIPKGALSKFKHYLYMTNSVVEKSDVLSIFTNPSPNLGGIVNGSMPYFKDSICTLTPVPAMGYRFINWTENGTIISTSNKYSFTVEDTHTFVANFSNSYSISTSINITNSGIINGTNSYTYGSTCKLIASPASGYKFIGWSENGSIVSTSATYSFTVGTDRQLIANFALLNNNAKVIGVNCSCNKSNDGKISITTLASGNYSIDISSSDISYSKSESFTGSKYTLSGLAASTYQVNLTINGTTQNFTVVINQPQDLSVMKVSMATNAVSYTLSGGENYYITINGNTKTTSENSVIVPLQAGENRISIATDKLCQGVYEENIYTDANGLISLFPNPTDRLINIGIPGNEQTITVEIYALNGTLVQHQTEAVPVNRLVIINVSSLSAGTYTVKIKSATVNGSVKLVKK